MTSNSRIGFHYYPDDRHYTQRDLEQWLPILLRLSARWLVLQAPVSRAIPEAFVRGLTEAGIHPIVWIKSPVLAVGASELAPMIAGYGQWGVRDLVIYDRPNMRSSWSAAEWSRPGLVERFVDRLLPILQLERSAGMHPVFPALEPGGDYWDTSFLETALKSMLRRGHSSLIQEMRVAAFAWTYDQPLDWGANGPAAWPEAYPYHPDEQVQNQIGFRTFDWYAAISESVTGRVLPMIIVAGGAGKPNSYQPEEITASLRAVLGGDVPDSVVSFNFHVLAADQQAAEHGSAWFASPSEPKSIVSAAERMLGAGRQVGSPDRAPKAFRHYVLVPTGDMPQEAWLAVRELAKDAIIGFSAEEAGQASMVTIVADEASIPPSVERKLVQGGAQVRRIRPEATHPVWQFMRRDSDHA
jgi:hypothetical protein